MPESKGIPPTVYVIAGPNGAGKTTFAEDFLPKSVMCREFLNADLIAAGLAPFAPQTQDLRAGRLLLERIDELTQEGLRFGFETTLAGRGLPDRLRRIKSRGYRMVVFYLWLPNPELAVARVEKRAQQGGHSIPETVIRRRFRASLANFVSLVRPMSDVWWLLDASRFPPVAVAREESGTLTVIEPSLYNRIVGKRDSNA